MISIEHKMRCAVSILFLISAVLAEYVSYEGYKVYRVVPSNKNQLKTLETFGKNNRLDFWSPLRSNGKPVDVMVEPPVQESFVFILNGLGIPYVTLIENVEEIVQRERLEQAEPSSRFLNGRISFDRYNRHSEINAYLDQLALEHSDIVSLENIGKSYEGRDLKVIRISTNPNANKPVIFVDAGIHAREWIAPAEATYIINQLVENSNNTGLLEKVDWHILPVVNPDGYEYSHTRRRLWRKTRSKGEKCYGADGNRNFGFHWGETGASSNECDDDYMGRSPFSEVETQAIRDYILKHKNRVKMYVTIHSFGEYILYPWGFTSDLPDDHEELQSLGEAAGSAIEKVYGTEFTVGSSTNVLYAAAGGSDDWVKGVAGVELSYTLELRGAGIGGFFPPRDQILPIVAETWEGFKVFHKHVESKFA